MQITIIKRNKLSIITLPEKVSGSYWITNFENGRKINLISVEESANGWNLISNQDTIILDSKDMVIPNIILSEYQFYLLKSNYKNEKFFIYCSPVYDKTYKELEIKLGSKIVVGSNKECDIRYSLNGIPDKTFMIDKKNSYYYLTLLDEKFSVYVNQKRVISSKRLEYGDIIFIFGLKLILMRNGGIDYLLVNNPRDLVTFNILFHDIELIHDDFVDDHEELYDDYIYKDDNYFYRTPHFYKALNPYSVTIDAPPTKRDENKKPTVLTIGPMLTMSMTSLVMLLATFYSMNKGESNLSSSITTIVMALVMLASTLLWPLITNSYQNFSDKRAENKRQELYRKYISSKEAEIQKEMELQKYSLLDNNFTVTDSQKVILEHNIKLWQRRIGDNDFLALPVGIGDMPMLIDIKYPEEHFSLASDPLLEIAHSLGKKDRTLKDVPIIYSFNQNTATGVVGEGMLTKEFIDRLILQIVSNYSYDELKIVTFTSIDNESDWDYVKILPHSWSNDRTLRYFGSSNDDYREIIYFLEKVYNERKQKQHNEEKKDVPHYIIITNAIKSIDSYDFIKNVMLNGKDYGFNIIMLVDKVSALPNECKNFIQLNRNECTIFSSVLNSTVQNFKIDFSPIDDIYNCAKELANIPINIKSDLEMQLPDTYQFLEMYQVGKIEQLNAIDRWKKSNPILSLQVPVGIGKSGEIINLDLHEKYHGPHGLIAGTTGSGKSEFIITYILSLAINYHPYEVQIILIDYKGGSLAGAFSNDNYQLPHLAGTITNLDGNELNRSLVSIDSEIKRRQAIFNKAKKISNESIIDIYKYQKLWREGKLEGMEPVAHLFIISDEFAELKEQQPEFMEKLISAARVGRSLGIHLILATQKPAGVVDPQIWSNTRFRVCLKVQDATDSQEILKKPDAAYLKKTGRFYLQVGYDEVFTLGQSAWTGGQYYPSVVFEKDVDTSINVINNIGFVTISKELEAAKKREPLGEELPNIVKYLSNIANKENIMIRRLWLDKIPENIYVDSLKSKYNFIHEQFCLNPIIGEYDDPTSQSQFSLTVPLSKYGNAAIFGITDSGKEEFLLALIYSIMSSYSVQEVNFYIVDLGSEALGVFSESPYVGDVVFATEKDKLKNLFKLINGELIKRKELFANFGGSYQSYIRESTKNIPNIVVIINNYESFMENFEDLIEEFGILSREAFRYGIYFVISVSSDASLRLKIKQNFSLLYALQQNSDIDYSSILGNVRGKVPAKIKGRGLFKNGGIYEFQTAKIAKDNVREVITDLCKLQHQNMTYKAKRIPTLPRVVDYEAVKDDISLSADLIIGINNKDLNVEKFNFRKNVINCISSYEISDMIVFTNALINQAIYLNVYELIVINATELNISNPNLEGKIYSSNIDLVLENIMKYIIDVYDIYKDNGFNDEVIKNQKKYMVFIYGINDLINKLSDQNKSKFAEVIKYDNQIGLVSFVLIDNPNVIKTYNYEDWFRNGADTTRGIWIGSGLVDQGLFKVLKYDREDREDITNEYGYIIQNSKIVKVKLLTDFKVK